MEFAGSPKRDKLEEIGERILASHMTGKPQNNTAILSQTDDVFQIVIELSKILKSIENNPTPQQLEKVELLANSLTRQLQTMKKVPNPEIGDNSRLFESYKILSCALLLLQKYQNYRSLLLKYEELKQDYDLNNKLHQEEIEALKNNESVSFRTLASNTQNCAEQISQAKKETLNVQTQFAEYKNAANKVFASIRKYLNLHEGTSLKDLNNEINLKLRTQQNASVLDQDYDKLRNEIKNLSSQNLVYQARDRQVSEEVKSLREASILKENQIAELIQEKESLQNRIKDLVFQQQIQQQQQIQPDISHSGYSEPDKSDIFVLQTDLNTSKLNLETSQKKIERLKAKLKKTRDELTAVKDENESFKQQIETLQLELHHFHLEGDNQNEDFDQSKNANDNHDKKADILVKDAEIEKLKSALDKIAEKLQTQSTELIQSQQIKDNLIYCLQKQTSLISGIIKTANESEKEIQVKEVEKGDAMALLRKVESENDKLKMFVTGVGQIVAANSAPELAGSVSNMIESLSIDAFREFFYSNIHREKDEEESDDDKNPKELIDRLFGYLEDQIEILQSISNDKIVTDSNKKMSILRSCSKANKFVNDYYSSMYSDPSIFHSFGLVVDPSELTNSVKTFLQTFTKKVKNNKNSKTNKFRQSQSLVFDNDNEFLNDEKEDEFSSLDSTSRELFIISKEAIAMNALLRNIASLLRKENEKLSSDLKQAKEQVEKVHQVEDETKSRLESIEKRFNDTLATQKEALKRSENILDSLNLLNNNGLLSLPPRLHRAIKNNDQFNQPLSNSEIEAFLASKNKKKEQKAINDSETEELRNKLEKVKKLKKQLKAKVSILSKQLEELMKKQAEQLDSYKNEIESLSKAKESLEDENEALMKNNESTIAALNEDWQRKLAEAKKSATKEVELTIDRIRADFQSDLKGAKTELKAKVKKAEGVAQSQKERADNLKAHYEALLESARTKLNAARKSESEAKEEVAKLESENRQLKAKTSSMTIDNKMLAIQLSSYEQRNDKDGDNGLDMKSRGAAFTHSLPTTSSIADDQILTRMKQTALIAQLEEKVDSCERQTRDFLVSVKEMFRSYSEIGDNFLTFESAKKVLQRVSSEISKMKEDSGKFSEAIDELNKIKSVVSPHPGVSTAFAVSVKIEQMQKEIQKLRKQQ